MTAQIDRAAFALAGAEARAESVRAEAAEAADRAREIQSRADACRAAIAALRAGRGADQLSDSEAGRIWALNQDLADLERLHVDANAKAARLQQEAGAAAHEVELHRVQLDRAQAAAELAQVHMHALEAEAALCRALPRLMQLAKAAGADARLLSSVWRPRNDLQRAIIHGVPPSA